MPEKPALLKDKSQLATVFLERYLVGGDLLSVNHKLSGCGKDKPSEYPQQSGFAAPGGADYCQRMDIVGKIHGI